MASVLGNTWKNQYAEELVQTAKALVAPGKGILAADESTSTIGKRVSVGFGLGELLVGRAIPARAVDQP